MPIDSTLRGLMLRIDETCDPGTQPERSYNFTNSASSTWTLARIKAYPQSGFGGEATRVPEENDLGAALFGHTAPAIMQPI